jgi:hypothetical protein
MQPGEVLRGRVRIQFVDEHGMEEAGIDGGGLFKDFMEHLVREVGSGFRFEGGLEGCAVTCGVLHVASRMQSMVPAPLTTMHVSARSV